LRILLLREGSGRGKKGSRKAGIREKGRHDLPYDLGDLVTW